MGLAAAVVGAAVVGGVASNVAANKASKAQRQASDAAIGATKQAATGATSDVNRIFPQAQETANLGFQGALDVFGQSAPAQMDVFQQGNLGAQQQLLAGLPQIQNAILGGNVDLSGLQPFKIQQPDLGFLNQQLPPAPLAINQMPVGLPPQEIGIVNPLGGLIGGRSSAINDFNSSPSLFANRLAGLK